MPRQVRRLRTGAGLRPRSHQRLFPYRQRYERMRRLPSQAKHSSELPGVPPMKQAMKPTRRDLLAWSGGATAGIMITPVPWKLLDDVSIWTQNWPGVPQPARGPVEVKCSFCTLCPQGCAMRVRMAAGWAVGVAPNGGALCPLAFAAHQLNWHPRRLRQVLHRGKPSSWTAARAAFRTACASGPLAIIDGR